MRSLKIDFLGGCVRTYSQFPFLGQGASLRWCLVVKLYLLSDLEDDLAINLSPEYKPKKTEKNKDHWATTAITNQKTRYNKSAWSILARWIGALLLQRPSFFHFSVLSPFLEHASEHHSSWERLSISRSLPLSSYLY